MSSRRRNTRLRLVLGPQRATSPAPVGRRTIGSAEPSATPARKGHESQPRIGSRRLTVSARQPSFTPDPQYGTSPGQPPYRDHRQPGLPSGHPWSARTEVVAAAPQGTDRARQPSRADHHRGDRQRQRKSQAGRQRFRRRHHHAYPHGDTQPDTDAPRDECGNSSDASPGIRYNRPGIRVDYSRRAATSSVHCARRLSPADQRGELLRTRRILPRCRPWDIRGSWRWGSDHLRRQGRLALGAITTGHG